MEANKSRERTVVNFVLVYILLFSSGSWRYNLADEFYLVLGFVAALAAWLMYSDRKINTDFLIYIIFLSGLLFLLSLYTGGSLSFLSVISVLMEFLLAYLILRTVGRSFVDTYIKVIVFLALFSLFGYITDRYDLFDGVVRHLPQVGNRGYEGFLYVYRFSWHITRNNSIFFEPGAYQGFLNAAMFMLFFLETGFSRKKQRVYVAILMTTLVTTFSTTGFLIFLVMSPFVLYKSNIMPFRGKMILVTASLMIIGIFSSQFHQTFVSKISDYLSANEYEFSYSAQTRSAAYKTDIKIFKEHVFGIGLKEYHKEFSRLGRTENDGSSNGVTRTFAVYGMPYGVFIFCSYFLAFRRLLTDGLLISCAFVMFLLFLAGESYFIVSPVCYAVIAGAFMMGRKTAHDHNQHEAVAFSGKTSTRLD